MIIKLHPRPGHSKGPALFLGYSKLIALLAASLSILCYFFVDRLLAIYLNNNGSIFDGLSSLFAYMIEPIHFLTLIPFLYFLNKLLWKSEKLSQTLFPLILLIPTLYLISSTIGKWIGRSSAQMLISSAKWGLYPGSASSFPSISSVMVGSVIAVMSYHVPKRSWHLALIGLCVSFSEVLQLTAFVSDVILSYLLALIFGQYLYVKIKARKIIS
jgi:hypothetical protein